MHLRFAPGVLVILAACGPKPDATPPAPTPPPEVTFSATEFAFAGPDTIAPGFTHVKLVNKGTQEHHLILAIIDSGKTMDDVMAAMKKDPMGVPPYLKFVGASGGITPGDSSGSTINLAPGTYLIACFVPDPKDNKAHFEKGMMKTLTVTGTPGTAVAPTSDVDLRLADLAFDLPAMTAGTHTIHVMNSGPQVHEAQLVRLNDGVDTKKFLAGLAPTSKVPPSGKSIGGSGGLSPGKDNYWTVTLTPGTYLLLCFVPDAKGQPHFMSGMTKEFTIAP